MKKLALLAIASTVMFTGCASFKMKPLAANVGSTLKDQTVAYTVRAKPDFAAMTAVNVQFGLFGALAAISGGNEIITKNNVEDPAVFIASELAKELQNKRGSQIAVAPIQTKDSSASKIADLAKGAAKFVLDVQTVGWSLSYFPTDWTHYRVIYTAKARLIDATNQQVIAEGFCKNIPDSNTGAPSWDELVSNNAVRLKADLSSYATQCVKTLSAGMLVI